jgi:ribonuclease R
MSSLPSADDIQALLSGFKRALHPRELASRLEIPPEDYPGLVEILDQLELDGAIKVLPGGRVRAVTLRGGPRKQNPPPREESWEGDIAVHPKGFAFVTASGKDDVFIPPDAVYEALHRDRVRVRVTGRSRKGLEGVVAEVLERRNTRIPGVIQRRRKSAWLEPDDSRIRGPILLAGDVGDAKDGDAAVVDIIRFPQFADELPEGQVVEILGPQGDPQTEVKKILLREGVSEVHSPEALQNAEQMAHRLRANRLGTRRDLRHVPLPTIDPEDARDHDDAIWVERSGEGYRVYIAIADVSEYVRADSPLDEEARARGCTIYLPDRAIPMLPRALAGDLCSLLPEQDRFCLCVIAELDRSGQVKDFEIVEGLMRSCAKLTYDGVARALGLDPESPQSPKAEEMKGDLEVLQELAEKLRKNRMRRGALDLDLPEARVLLDETSGAPIEVKKRATRPGLKKAYSLVEEMMLLANELVARWLSERNVPAIYRIHGKPDEEKLERLATLTKDLNLNIEMDDLLEPLGAAKFLGRIQNHERKYVLEMLMLRSLKQAVYDVNNIGHFGLASERYVHFTSPIRRYPDLRVHRQIKALLRGGGIDRSDEAIDDLAAAADESSKKERAAMEIEREVQNLYRAIYMKGHIGDEYEGRISGLSGAGLYVSIDDPCVDVLIPFEDIGPDEYELDEQELGVFGSRSGEKLMLGDLLQLTITDVGIMRRTVYAKRNVNEDDYDLGEKPAFLPRRTFRGPRSAGTSAPGAQKTGGRRAAGKSFKDRDAKNDDAKGPGRASGPTRSRAGSKTTKKVSGRTVKGGAKSAIGGAKSTSSPRTRPSAGSARRKKTTRRK